MNKATIFRTAGTAVALGVLVLALFAAKLLWVSTSNHEVAAALARALGLSA